MRGFLLPVRHLTTELHKPLARYSSITKFYLTYPSKKIFITIYTKEMHERPTLHKRIRFLYPLIGPFRYIKKQIRNIYFRSAVYQNDVFCRAKMAQMNLIALTKILQDHDWFIDWCKEQNLLDKTSSTCVQKRIQLDKSFIARRV